VITKHRASADAFVREDAASKNFDGLSKLVLNGTAASRRRTFLYFPNVPRSGLLVSASLEVSLRGAWAGGPHTITVRNVDGKWSSARITWANAPAVRTTPNTTLAITGGASAATYAIDVTALVSEIVAGGAWYGFRLEVDTAGNKDLHSNDNAQPDLRARLVLNWSEAPYAPSDLRPAPSTIVAGNKPRLGWTYRDPQGDTQGAFRVRISTASTIGANGILTTTEFDSGWITSAVAEADLNALGYAGLPTGTARYWQVQVRDVNGHESAVSDVAQITRQLKGGLTISSPANLSTTNDRTPPITSTLATVAQTKIAYKIERANLDGSWTEVVAFSPHAAAAAAGVAYTEHVPDGVITRDLSNYRITVRSWDAFDRDAIPGDAAFVEAVTQFQYDESVPTAGVPALTVTYDGPAVVLEWTRSSQPDAFVVKAGLAGGSRPHVLRIEAADAFVSGTTYRWRWYGAIPRTLYDVEVAALVESGAQTLVSATNDVETNVRTDPWGIHLADTTGQTYLKILGQEAAALAEGFNAETLFPPGGGPVRIVDDLRGLEGSIAGSVHSSAERSTLRRYVRDSIRQPGRIRLILANTNVPVLLGELAVPPQPTMGGEDYAVDVAVWQQSEFEIEVP
jgi:hypothetical protein